MNIIGTLEKTRVPKEGLDLLIDEFNLLEDMKMSI